MEAIKHSQRRSLTWAQKGEVFLLKTSRMLKLAKRCECGTLLNRAAEIHNNLGL